MDFLYRGSPIEKVKSYTYLGVPFSSSSLGLDAANAAIGRAAMATGTALSILSRAKSDSWDGSLKLYNGIVSSTLLYGSQVWGIRYIDALERAQTNFFKRLLLLPGCTAGYALRVELGLVPLAHRVVKLAIDWIVRVLDMDQTRLPKVCMVRLMRLYLGGASNVRYNWLHQLAECLGRAGIALSEDILNLNFWRNGQANMLKRYREFLIAEDVARLLNSSSLQCPPALGRLNEECAPYLRVRGAFIAGRTLAQLRLASNRYCRLTFRAISHRLESEELCIVCNLGEHETVYHFLYRCPIYKPYRDHYLKSLPAFNCEDASAESLMQVQDRRSIRAIHYYTTSSLRLRAFARND